MRDNRLLNYTTTIAVDKTVAEIQSMLARKGATAIQIDYASGQPIALSFQIATEIGVRGYRLPANIDAVYKTLTLQYERKAVRRVFVTKDQAARVGWRILKSWLEAQLALLETRMATLAEIMLPWMIAGQDGQTVYQLFESRQLALPAPQAAEA
jgi:hypothetical protein